MCSNNIKSVDWARHGSSTSFNMIGAMNFYIFRDRNLKAAAQQLSALFRSSSHLARALTHLILASIIASRYHHTTFCCLFPPTPSLPPALSQCKILQAKTCKIV